MVSSSSTRPFSLSSLRRVGDFACRRLFPLCRLTRFRVSCLSDFSVVLRTIKVGRPTAVGSSGGQQLQRPLMMRKSSSTQKGRREKKAAHGDCCPDACPLSRVSFRFADALEKSLVPPSRGRWNEAFLPFSLADFSCCRSVVFLCHAGGRMLPD